MWERKRTVLTINKKYPDIKGDYEIAGSDIPIDGTTITVNELGQLQANSGSQGKTISSNDETLTISESDTNYDLSAANSLNGKVNYSDANQTVSSSNKVATMNDLSSKQDTLIAGTNISIENNVISATGSGAAVTSVNTKTGDVVLTGEDININSTTTNTINQTINALQAYTASLSNTYMETCTCGSSPEGTETGYAIYETFTPSVSFPQIQCSFCTDDIGGFAVQNVSGSAFNAISGYGTGSENGMNQTTKAIYITDDYMSGTTTPTKTAAISNSDGNGVLGGWIKVNYTGGGSLLISNIVKDGNNCYYMIRRVNN